MHTHDLSAWQHDHTFQQDRKGDGETRTLIVVALTLVTMAVEIGAGIGYGSIALLADGLHMGSHATALGITAFAYWYARRHARDTRYSFGTGKVNALGGFTGAILLLGFALFMGVESLGRFFQPVEIVFDKAILVAVVGLAVNGISAWILGAHDHDHGHEHDHGHAHRHAHHEPHEDHNRRAAYLHVMADALTSLLAIVALLCAKYLGWQWMDPVMGLVGTVLVVRWSWGLLKQSSQVLLDRQVATFDDRVRHAIETGSTDRVSDLHVWSIGPGIHAGIVALVSDDPVGIDDYRDKIQHAVPELVHTTIEIHRCVHHSAATTTGIA